MRRIMYGVASVGLVLGFLALIAFCNWWVEPNVNNFTGVTEVGWCPVVSPKIEVKPVSCVAYVLVSINYQTNDVASYRECFFNDLAPALGRENPTTGVWEVYVVAKEFKYPTPHPQYFAMRYARDLRKNK